MAGFQNEIKPSYLAEIERTFAKFMCSLLPDKVRDGLERVNKNKDVRLLVDILTFRERLGCEDRNEKPFIKQIAMMMKENRISDSDIRKKIDKCRYKFHRIRKELNKPAHDHDKKDDSEFQKKIAVKIEEIIESIIAPDIAEEYLERLHEIRDSMGIENDDKVKFLSIRDKLDLADKGISELKKRYAA